jgi:hypothetical protein
MYLECKSHSCKPLLIDQLIMKKDIKAWVRQPWSPHLGDGDVLVELEVAEVVRHVEPRPHITVDAHLATHAGRQSIFGGPMRLITSSQATDWTDLGNHISQDIAEIWHRTRETRIRRVKHRGRQRA